jgi:hypothetical protein
MKIENLKRSAQLAEVLKSINTALEQVETILEAKINNIFGFESNIRDNALYSLHLSEYTDGSGSVYCNLTNCGVGIEVLNFTRTALLAQKAKIIREIEAL